MLVLEGLLIPSLQEGRLIDTFDAMIDGEVYICASFEKFKPLQYGHGLGAPTFKGGKNFVAMYWDSFIRGRMKVALSAVKTSNISLVKVIKHQKKGKEIPVQHVMRALSSHSMKHLGVNSLFSDMSVLLSYLALDSELLHDCLL